jgi:osmoprotectant transport system permease protein
MTWWTDLTGWLSDGANWSGPTGALALLGQHVRVSIISLVVAAVVVVPLGLWLGHVGRGGVLAINIGNVGRAVPTFAILVLLNLAPAPFGSSQVTVITSLVLFAVPPILTNTYVGVREVDRSAVDAARGMGMSGWQVLRGVELPLAAPLVVQGLRLAAVQVVATATIAALVGGGGLGRLITQGFSRQDQPMLLSGAVLVGGLALVVEGLFEVLGRSVAPAGSAASSGRRPRVKRSDAGRGVTRGAAVGAGG